MCYADPHELAVFGLPEVKTEAVVTVAQLVKQLKFLQSVASLLT